MHADNTRPDYGWLGTCVGMAFWLLWVLQHEHTLGAFAGMSWLHGFDWPVLGLLTMATLAIWHNQPREFWIAAGASLAGFYVAFQICLPLIGLLLHI